MKQGVGIHANHEPQQNRPKEGTDTFERPGSGGSGICISANLADPLQHYGGFVKGGGSAQNVNPAQTRNCHLEQSPTRSEHLSWLFPDRVMPRMWSGSNMMVQVTVIVMVQGVILVDNPCHPR